MSEVILDKLPLPVVRAIHAGKRLRVTTSGKTVAIVEPREAPASSPKSRRARMTAEQWIATVGDKLPAHPHLDAAKIVRAGRDQE